MRLKLNRKWKIVLLHHTHLDIGYTHTQEKVLEIQFKHLEKAMDLIEKNLNRPFNYRFRWNPEITWAIEEWLKKASDNNKARFVKYVQEGYIGLDGLYGNILTGLCRPEELMENFQVKKDLENLTGKKIESAMITDIPGWNWGLVTGLAENGIKYLSCGPNRGDRIGYILKDWGDRPFYWKSPSQAEEVLVFVHGKGYSWFHSGLKKKKNLSKKLTPRRLARYLQKLEQTNYPYNTIIIRYNIGQDNGPPDSNLCDIIEGWNSRYPGMKLSLSTTAQAMKEFEQEYGQDIPTFSGDLTPYWEDGALSTSRETAIARDAGERLSQAQIFSTMLNIPHQKETFQKAWQATLLYNEHTWGAYNSISRPDHSFAKQQWEWKRQRAMQANYKAYQIMQNLSQTPLLSPISYINHLENDIPNCKLNELSIFNTHNWSVTQIVKVKSDYNQVINNEGKIIPSQQLNDGRLAFMVSNIPPFGIRTYSLKKTELEEDPSHSKENNATIKNDHVQLSVDPELGTIASIIYKGKEFVKQSTVERFNQYIFATSKWGTKIHPHRPNQVEVKKLNRGPLISSIQIISDGYRTNKIITTITIEAISERIYLHNLVDRPVSRRKEGIYFEFPFAIEQGRVRYDTIFGSAVVDKDQMQGGNRNFITATRWFDVSDEDFGISCALIDAPIFKSGSLVHDPFRMGDPKLCGWLRKTDYNGTLYSYIMNNYWMTNYKADQPGKTLFRYVFKPHCEYREEETHHFAIEEMQPLLVFGRNLSLNINKIPFKILNENIEVTSLKFEKESLYIRLFNLSNTPTESEIEFGGKSKLEVLSPNKDEQLTGNFVKLKAHETIYIKESMKERKN
jgi:hypothetical protein